MLAAADACPVAEHVLADVDAVEADLDRPSFGEQAAQHHAGGRVDVVTVHVPALEQRFDVLAFRCSSGSIAAPARAPYSFFCVSLSERVAHRAVRLQQPAHNPQASSYHVRPHPDAVRSMEQQEIEARREQQHQPAGLPWATQGPGSASTKAYRLRPLIEHALGRYHSHLSTRSP